MSSLLCPRLHGGNVIIHANDVVEELIIDSNDSIKTEYLAKNDKYRKRSRLKRPQSTPNLGHHYYKVQVDPETLINHTLKLQDWINEKSLKVDTDSDSKDTREMYNRLLEKETTFVTELGSMLYKQELIARRRKEILHKRWIENVYDPIHSKIDQEMTSEHFTSLTTRKREIYKQYLEHVNKKGHVFLDTIAADEYYPSCIYPVRPSLVTIETRNLRDPLSCQRRQQCDEERIMFQCANGSKLTSRELEQIRLPPLPLVPLGRQGTECSTWLSMSANDIESPIRLSSSPDDIMAPSGQPATTFIESDLQQRMRTSVNQSQIYFENWANAPVDQSNVDEELHIKRIGTRRPASAVTYADPLETMVSFYDEPEEKPDTHSIGIQVEPSVYSQISC